MLITLVTAGIPNHTSEQANNDALIYIKKLSKKKIKINLICIWNEKLNTSKNNKKKQLDYLKKFKNINQIFIINEVNKNNIEKFLNGIRKILYSNPVDFFSSKGTYLKIKFLFKKYKFKNVLNVYEIPSFIIAKIIDEINYKPNIINIFGVYRKKSEILILKNLIKESFFKNFFKILNCILFILKIDKIYKKTYLISKLIICPSKDTYNYLKKIGFKRILYSKPLSKNLSSLKEKNKKKKIKVLMIGNLRSTFMIDSLFELSKNLVKKLKVVNDRKNFTIRIVGKFNSQKKFNLLKKYKFIKFTGWVKNSNLEYQNSQFLFATNKYNLAAKTKIIEAMSCGKVVVTYKSNIHNIYDHMINKKNILIAKNHQDFIDLFNRTLYDRKLYNLISTNAKKTYLKYYNPDKIMKLVISKILRVFK